MRGDNLVLDAKMVECKDIFSRATLKCVQILDLKVVLAPLELETGPIGHLPLQVRLVQQVVDSFFIDLKVAAIDRELFPSSIALLFDHLKQKSYRTWHDSLVLSRFHDSNWLSFVILAVLVSLHTVRFTRASLSIGENSRIIALLKF